MNFLNRCAFPQGQTGLRKSLQENRKTSLRKFPFDAGRCPFVSKHSACKFDAFLGHLARYSNTGHRRT